MNSRENFYAMLDGGRPEWLPFDLPTTEPVERRIREKTGLSSPEAFGIDFREASASYLGDDPAVWRSALENIGFHFPESSSVGRFGMACVHPPVETLGDAVHLTEMLHPLSVVEDVAQLEKLPWPDTSDPAHYAGYRSWCERVHAAGKVARAGQECTIFEDTWYLRGMDNVFCDWAEENPVSDWLLDYFTARSIHNCQAFARAGFDMIKLGDDVGMQNRMLLSMETWRRHLKPRLKSVIDAIREASAGRKVWVQYHSDGDVTPLVDDLIEIGVDILNPVQPECMNLEAIAEQYQTRLAFSGMIGTQTTMPFGNPDDVRGAVARCRRLHESGASIIVAPTHVLEPDVPWENITAFIEAVRVRLP
ncbi:MAG: uroporphyrinogen decarboxylase family protein [Verrucomicrobiota bacterium]